MLPIIFLLLAVTSAWRLPLYNYGNINLSFNLKPLVKRHNPHNPIENKTAPIVSSVHSESECGETGEESLYNKHKLHGPRVMEGS